MPKLLYSIKTPLGEFASSGQAAAAHKVDRSTIMNRCETDPDNYKKVPKPPAIKKVYTPVSTLTWPLTWSQYKWLSFEAKDEIWHTWCVKNKKNPDLDESVDEFFDIMDNTQETQDDKEQVI
jgi:hypothetical protein